MKFIQKKWALILFIFSIILFLSSLYQNFPNEDEAVIAGHAYFFNKLGYVKSDLYAGYGYDWEIRQYHYHKLFVLTGALMSSIFGFNIYSFKFVSLLCAVIFFVYFYKYIKEYESTNNSKIFFYLASSILLFNTTFFTHSFMYRPEIMVICLGFMSYYYLIKGLDLNKNYWFILAGVFSGLSTFAHLNGLIFSIAGFILLLLRKKIKPLLLFSLFAGIFTLLYFFDIHSIEELKKLFLQFTTDPNIINNDPVIIRLLNEHMRFFSRPKEIIFSLIFFVALIFTFKNTKRTHTNMLIYFFTLILSLGLLSHGKTTKYAINYFPFMIIIIVSYLFSMDKYPAYLRYSIFVLFTAYVGIHGYRNIQFLSNKIDIANHNAALSELIPEKNVKISAPSTFAFNEIKNYTIRGEIAFDHHYNAFKSGKNKTLEDYFAFSKHHGDKYILIDKLTDTRKVIFNSKIDTLQTDDTLYGYRLITRDENAFVFKLK